MLRRTLAKQQGNFNFGGKTGQVHPMVLNNKQTGYRGPGWMLTIKQLGQDTLSFSGGNNSSLHTYDRVGNITDPEDPRHQLSQTGHNSEGALAGLWAGFIDKIQRSDIPAESKLLQVLYNNYLEPWSFHRVVGQLENYGKVPNHDHTKFDATVSYVGQTAALSGDVFVSGGCTVMEGVTMRGDTNSIMIAEGAQILENCCLISDAPTTLHHYQRHEMKNPYQKIEMVEGVCSVGHNSVVEANCVLDSCQIGSYNRIGHGSHLMKGVKTGVLSQVLPGSVVPQNSNIGDGEIWGGVPAKKVGKTSKYEYKKPYAYSMYHREMAVAEKDESCEYGAQITRRQIDAELVGNTIMQFESDITPSVKAQMRELLEKREPFEHTVCRISQSWTPAGRAEYLVGNVVHTPCPEHGFDMRHNDDSRDGYNLGPVQTLWEAVQGKHSQW